MSEENVKFVLDGYARFNAGEKVPELWFFSPDAEFHAAREDPDSAVHRGLDAVRAQYARWVDAYPDLTVELAHVLTLRDGRVTRMEEYSDRTEGLEAAGLSE